jgi:hypothetical protein
VPRDGDPLLALQLKKKTHIQATYAAVIVNDIYIHTRSKDLEDPAMPKCDERRKLPIRLPGLGVAWAACFGSIQKPNPDQFEARRRR